MKNKRKNIIKSSLLAGIAAFTVFSVGNVRFNLKDFSLHSDYLIHADNTVNYDSTQLNDSTFNVTNLKTNPKYDYTYKTFNLTSDTKNQAGTISFKDKISFNDDFKITGKINIGTKNQDHGGGDGIAMFFHSGNVEDVGTAGQGLGAGNLNNVTGFKVDTYRNSSDTKIGSSSTYATIIHGNKQNPNPDYKGTSAQPLVVSDPSQNKFRDFTFEYSGSTKTLTVTYDGKTWTVTNPDWFKDSGDGYVFSISAGTGSNSNLQQLKLDSMKYTKAPGYNKDDHKIKIADVKAGDKKITGKGTPGDTIKISDGEGNELGTTTVDSDGNYVYELKDGQNLTEGEKISAKPITINSNDVDNPYEGDTVTTTVGANEIVSHKLVLNTPDEGQFNITGTGTPGDTVIIYDDNNKELGRRTVLDDGTFTITSNRQLIGDEKLTAKVIDKSNNEVSEDKIEGSKYVKVNFIPDDHKPTINLTNSGDKKITGTATPNDTLTIKKNGETIAENVTVNSDGSYSADITSKLSEDDIIEVIPTNPKGSIGTSATQKVDYDQDNHIATIQQAYGGTKTISGYGTPGDTVTIIDKDGNKLAENIKVDKNGNFLINDASRLLVDGETLTVTPHTQFNGQDKEGKSSDFEVQYSSDAHTPTIDKPESNQKTITGTGVAGDTIVITDESGKTIAKTKVNEDGTYNVEADRDLRDGETLTVTPITNVNNNLETGNSAKTTLDYDASEHKPTINGDIKEDSQGKTVEISGKEGDTVVLKDKDGNSISDEVVIGSDGTAKVTIKDDAKLTKGDDVYAESTTKDGDTVVGTSDSDKQQVVAKDYDASEHTVVVDQPKDGDQKVTGEGTPGDTIVITDKDGNVIGKGEIGEDGKYDIPVDKPLNKGDEVTVTPSTDGKDGTPTTSITTDKDKPQTDHTVDINTPVEGDKNIIGTGTPGDKVIVTDKDGNKIGEGTVGEDGKYDVKVDKPFTEGEKVTVTPETDGKPGQASDTTVGHTPKTDHTVKVDQPKDGDKIVSVNGTANDKVIIKDADGNKIGEGTIGSDGKGTVTLDRPLVGREKITATPETNGKPGITSDPVTVSGNSSNNGNNGNNGNNSNNGNNENVDNNHETTVDVPNAGDDSIHGTGKPGDTVVIKDKDGNTIGEGTVDKDGNFDVKVNPKIKDDQDYIVKVGDQTITVSTKRPDSRIKKNTVIYSLNPIYRYEKTVFKVTERQGYYTKKPRVNRPMFIVKQIVKNKNGLYRYLVKDVNHKSGTFGKTGYITTKKNYVLPVYYYGKHNAITVINPKGVNAYKNKDLTGKARHLKQGTIFKVTGIVRHNLTTRYKLSNGTYVTTNKKLVMMGRIPQVKKIKTKHAINVYRKNNLSGRKVKHIKRGTIVKVQRFEYSHEYSLKKRGTKVYKVSQGYITSNGKFVKSYR
ncbi:hypothetical protein GSH19_04395 [Lactobacillus sp. S2-2]|uniref:Ig-like domain-containing protein n=1 Tax=Lactobacillus sp. S2-2 TaxID=2692917 RepID=UPI001F26ACD6|nr:Ig-like domain-containing protein [Lactobacillus sp. S2-2]MCF6515393.1 hypothetical protein [Lactobacillus sp. S2-2]